MPRGNIIYVTVIRACEVVLHIICTSGIDYFRLITCNAVISDLVSFDKLPDEVSQDQAEGKHHLPCCHRYFEPLSHTEGIIIFVAVISACTQEGVEGRVEHHLHFWH